MSRQRVSVVGHSPLYQGNEIGNQNGGYANAIYKEENLGTITASNIASFVSEYKLGTANPKGLFPGMYITIQDGTYNTQWMCAGVNFMHNKGNTANAYGAEFIPRNQGFAYGQVMNDSNTTSGGYFGSKMYTFLNDTVVPKLEGVLGNHLLTQYCWLSTAVDTAKASQYSGWTGMASAADWKAVKAVLMSEPQVYGGSVWGGPYDVGEANQQLPVFRFISPVEFGRGTFWLRAVASSSYFASCGGNGDAGSYGASGTWLTVRPLIRIG